MIAGELNQPVSPDAMLRTNAGAATLAVPPADLHADVGATAPSGNVEPASSRGPPDDDDAPPDEELAASFDPPPHAGTLAMKASAVADAIARRARILSS